MSVMTRPSRTVAFILLLQHLPGGGSDLALGQHAGCDLVSSGWNGGVRFR